MTDTRSESPGVRRADSGRPVLVIGGAGFIGSNLCLRLLSRGRRVRVLDNLSRPGTVRNAHMLAVQDNVELILGDARDQETVRRACKDVDAVFHLAAQVAVTTSLINPIHDFEVNTAATLQVLEVLRAMPQPPILVYTSTNKVYGDLGDIELRDGDTRYEPVDRVLAQRGVSERVALSFHSPYGCSKGAADQYVLDYARSFALPATVFRMSCIYGPHQMGNEDQGWVAHFLMRAMAGEPISIFGDGKQVRDVLFVEDLIDAFMVAYSDIEPLRGRAFNVGGTPRNSVSLLEVIEMIGELLGAAPAVTFGPWRVSDQRWYASDVSLLHSKTGWRPRTAPQDGIRHLRDWLLTQQGSSVPESIAAAPQMEAGQ